MSSHGKRWGWHGREPGLTLDTEIRMERWRRLCLAGWKTREIADELGLSVAALQRSVIRARAAGCRAAIVHPLAYETGTGTSHLVHARDRAARLRRLQREREPSTA